MSNCFSRPSKSKVKVEQPKPKMTFDIKIPMACGCDGCARKVYDAAVKTKGVDSVELDIKQCQLKVSGKVDSENVLKKVRRTGKKGAAVNDPKKGAQNPSLPPFYNDKNKALPIVYIEGQRVEGDTLVNLFSDDNPNACSIM
ncbi:hypothetical protein OROMI_000810 [Orobanche minor]